MGREGRVWFQLKYYTAGIQIRGKAGIHDFGRGGTHYWNSCTRAEEREG